MQEHKACVASEETRAALTVQGFLQLVTFPPIWYPQVLFYCVSASQCVTPFPFLPCVRILSFYYHIVRSEHLKSEWGSDGCI